MEAHYTITNSRQSTITSNLRLAKRLVLMTSFLLVVTSCVIIVIVYFIDRNIARPNEFIQSNTGVMLTVLTAFGFFFLVKWAFGLVGSTTQSANLINIYGILLFVAVVLEIIGTAMYIIHQGQVKADLLQTMKEAMEHYKINLIDNLAWNKLQTKYGCCGIHHTEDWKVVFGKVPAYFPASCCSKFNKYDQCDDTYKEGCFESLNQNLSSASAWIALNVMVLIVVQVVGAVCAFKYAKRLSQAKSMRN